MSELHRLLQRQLKKAGLGEQDLNDPKISKLIEQIDTAYCSFDDDHKLIERAMELSSKELLAANRNLEKALVQAQAGAQAKSDFLANMSHEIRTPLNGITGLIKMLLESKLDDYQKELAVLANQSTKGLLSIINEILDLSKIEANCLTISPIECNVKIMLEELVKLFSAALHEKDITVLLNIADNFPDTVIADEHRLKQIITNLLGNAGKFTPKGGVIIVFLFADNQTKNSLDLRIAVSDTGIGISQEKQSIIFEPFSQADSTITRKYGGTGLGLTISSRIAKLMQGNLWVKSVENAGSSFHVSVPVQVAANKTIETVKDIEQVELPSGIKVLLAEDNLINQRVTLHLLNKLGCKVETALDGQEAVDKFKTGNFDLILMDCQMPKLSGFEATQQIRSIPEGQEIPIIALTALAMAGDEERCLQAGMNGYVSKPIEKKELVNVMARLTSGNADFSRQK